MAKLNPIDHLPDQMKRYLSIPMKLFTFWVIGSIVFLLLLFIFNQPDQRLSDGMNHFDDDRYMERVEETHASPSALIRELSISGRDDFKIKYKDKGVRVYHSDYPTLKLVREVDKIKLKGEKIENYAFNRLEQILFKQSVDITLSILTLR